MKITSERQPSGISRLGRDQKWLRVGCEPESVAAAGYTLPAAPQIPTKELDVLAVVFDDRRIVNSLYR